MEFLRQFETESEYINEKESFEYPQVSFTNDNGKVWVKDEDNYILATYLWDVTDENVEPKESNSYVYINGLFINEVPFFIENIELISINEEGHTTFKLHLYKETKIHSISLEESFWVTSNGYGNAFVPLISVDFSKAHLIFDYLPKYMFPASVKDITFGKNFNTSNVTNMDSLFCYCNDLNEINGIEYIDTSNVTNMYAMFNGCNSLTSLDLSSFNTSNVYSMGYMFNTCYNLTSLVLSNFDTFNVTDMGKMFCHCYSLTSLNLNNFDTLSVNDTSRMFSYCDNLNSIEFGNLSYVSNVESYYGMFEGVPSSCVLNLCSNTQESWDYLLSKSDVKFNSTVNYKTCEEPNE